MTIIGIDPGTIRTGYGIIDFSGGEHRLICSGVIQLNKLATIPPRLEKIYSELYQIIKKYRPDELAIETAFYGKNVQSTLKIGYARGVSILAGMHHGLYPSEYAPREVKKAITGVGSASKEQVAYMVKKILFLNNKLKLDESDALAVAVCHSGRLIKNVSGKKSWKKFIENNPERVIK
ncbi:MAG: crossover junction endodeoxyribonuclease RuvC [Ignavibacteriaceae bacterium]|nr:crossover junction endodeoxyribonuclease RuvC [Ignavibacteriaceae bacterium]